ncbi:MAG: hypothetical protein O4752_11265 [Trichodesmium sp. St4_bin8_1]|nr:hypothetical protein [Trichodesmium sp. St4_bin8_1]
MQLLSIFIHKTLHAADDGANGSFLGHTIVSFPNFGAHTSYADQL